MTSLCHGTLASASALQGVALALAWPWECSDGLGLGLGLGVCGLVNIPDFFSSFTCSAGLTNEKIFLRQWICNLGLTKFLCFKLQLAKNRDGKSGKMLFLFLLYDMSCNIRQQLIKTN